MFLYQKKKKKKTERNRDLKNSCFKHGLGLEASALSESAEKHPVLGPSLDVES